MNDCNLTRLILSITYLCITACHSSNDTTSSNVPPNVPVNVVATAGDGKISISWNPVADTTSFNLYWSTSSGVTKSNGNKIASVNSPIMHAGLVNSTHTITWSHH